MENHKIDRFFQDRLSRHEIDPSPQAWEAVNAKLNKKSTPIMWYSVAAAVTAVAVVAVLMLRDDNTEMLTDQQVYVNADHPTPQELTPLDIPFSTPVDEADVPEVKPEKQKKNVTIRAVRITEKQTLAQQMPKNDFEAVPMLDPIEFGMENETMAAVAIAELPEEPVAIQAPPGVSVQITYMATKPVKVDEKSKIEKLWAKAKEIKPGEMIGNLRETKNDFFNGKKN